MMRTYVKIVPYGSHTIEIRVFVTEKILYDGIEVSKRLSLKGTTHTFRVTEDGEEIYYRVSVGTRWHCLTWWAEVSRNGKVIYTDR